MPTVTETLQQARANATVNAAALLSVRTQAVAVRAAVEAWPASPGKGATRDQLSRLIAAYDSARTQALRLVDVATNFINAAGSVSPDPVPAAISWSTADF